MFLSSLSAVPYSMNDSMAYFNSLIVCVLSKLFQYRTVYKK